MKKLSSRARIIIISTIITIVQVAIQEVDFRVLLDFSFEFDPFKPVIIAFLVYIGTYWALFFRVKGERLFTVLAFPAINLFAMSLFSELILIKMLGGVEQIGTTLIATSIFFGYTYITLLTTNLLNMSYLGNIPLGQAARASQFVLSLITAYISFFLLFSNDIFILIRAVSLFVITFVLTYISLWAIKLKTRKKIVSGFVISLFLTFTVIVLSIWPVAAPYLALVLTLLFYIFLGIALEIREIINRSIWFEYTLLYILIVFLLILVAEWGINGTLI